MTDRVAVFCFSSSGELDVVLPLLKIWGIEDYTLVSFKKQIREKLRNDGFYSGVISGHLDDRAIANLSGSKIVRWLRFIANAIAAFWRYRKHDRLMFENGSSGREKNILIRLLVLTGHASRILFYPHGHAVTPADAYAAERWPAITRFAVRSGARILRLDGCAPDSRFLAVRYPILLPEWMEFVRLNAPQLYHDHVVILSRDVHPQYLLAENRSRMLSDTVAVLSKWFPTARIVLKAHPREFFDSDSIVVDGKKVEVTYENTYSVVRGAKLAVSFWTSAFFQCIALDVPVVEYHIPHDRFHVHYPNGSLTAAFIPNCRTRESLAAHVGALLERGSSPAA
jgi:hypothetical protein